MPCEPQTVSNRFDDFAIPKITRWFLDERDRVELHRFCFVEATPQGRLERRAYIVTPISGR